MTLSVDENETWSLPSRWTLLLADGSYVQLSFDADHSTRAGALAAGQEIRLVFELRGKLATEPTTLFSHGGLSWEIALSR